MKKAGLTVLVTIMIVGGILTKVAVAAPIGLYDYMNNLSLPFTAQTGSEDWTFHVGNNTGSLMGLLPGSNNVYGEPGPLYYRFGYPGGPGSIPGTAGSSETNGIFVHTAASGFVSAVLNVKEDTSFTQVNLTHELVGNANSGNGMNVTINSIAGGTTNLIGHVAMNSFTSQNAIFNFGGLSLSTGDKLEFLFDNNGSYLYDHGWIDVNFTSHPSTSGGSSAPAPVPEPGTIILLGSGLIGLVGYNYKRNKKKI